MVWDSRRTNFDRNLAVVIGIDRYRDAGIRNLSTAISDASAIANLLEQEYAYTAIRLFNEDVTSRALQHLFYTRIPEELNPGEGDRLIIYFAGHGLHRSSDDGPEGYLVPHDADPTDPASFLAMRDVYKALGRLECHHLLVILDCCVAGTFRWAGSRKAAPILEKINREHYYHFICHPVWQVITSSAHNQEDLDVSRLTKDNRQPVTNEPGSPFANEPHSPFALALLEGLQPGDDPQRVRADLLQDGVVTAHELFIYLQTRVKQLSGEQQAPGIYPLRPDYDKGEFIFTPPRFDPQVDLARAVPLNEENNPYRGLKSFDEKHARFFFGRQALIEELAKRLAQPNQVLTVVVGGSGSGKSSLVKAGLLPHLRTYRRTEIWRILEPICPGESPFISLARALLSIAHEGLLERLAEVSFLDDIFRQFMFEAESNKISVNKTLMKVADSWCGATPEAKLLLIEDYFDQLKELGNLQQTDQLKDLYDQILAELSAINQKFWEKPQYLSHIIAVWSQNHPAVQLLLVIDQFEELLTLSQDDRKSSNQTKQWKGDHPLEQKEWQKFLEALRIAIADHPQALRLVLTLRSDFEPQFMSSALEPYWMEARFPVRAMTSDELRQAIENPARKQAVYFEELKDDRGKTIGNLVSKLVDEVGHMPGALPLLSFTLSELYVRTYERWQRENSTDRTLRFADYEALGGVAGAITRRATEEYEALDENHQATIRRVMLRMVVLERGMMERRRVPEAELVYPNNEENERVKLIIARLVESSLLVKGQEMGEPYVEPAHDVLIRGWSKLHEWIQKERENLIWQERLRVAINDWMQNERSDEFLWGHNPRLPLLEQILNSDNSWLTKLEAEFVINSLQQYQHYRKAVPVFTKTEIVREGRSFVVVIGIDKYKYCPPLKNAVRDARGIQKALVDHLNFSEPDPKLSLFDSKATKKAILTLIEDKLPSVLGGSDNLLLFFAGHGETQLKEIPGSKPVEFGHIVPVDAKPEIWSSFIRVDWLLRTIGELPAKHILVILDACHSGFALGEAKQTHRSNEEKWRYQQELLRNRSRKVITSARRQELAQDGGGPILGNSLFTGFLINGLLRREADMDGNGIITSSELALWVQQRVSQKTGSSQTPDFGSFHLDDRGEMVISLPE